MFSKAIVRKPSQSMTSGLTTATLGKPDYLKALAQHEKYIDALKVCGLEVRVLQADENFPDSTFVEDVALLTPKVAIITNPGAPSRKGETVAMKDVLKNHYHHIEEIVAPGTLDAGDIMMVGSHYYIGLSARTNIEGAKQVMNILSRFNLAGSTITLNKVLHLKTGVAYLEHNNLVACGEFINDPEFQNFNILEISEGESYAANCIWVNDTVLLPAGFPQAHKTIAQAGYTVKELNVSEFQKLDGGISCLSLRF